MSQRRSSGGARREASDRITLRGDGADVQGWTLNRSRGGLRIIVEDRIRLDQVYEILFGDETTPGRQGRVVWIRDEADGQIAGVEFVGSSE